MTGTNKILLPFSILLLVIICFFQSIKRRVLEYKHLQISGNLLTASIKKRYNRFYRPIKSGFIIKFFRILM